MVRVFDKIIMYTGDCNTYYIDDKVKVLVDAGAIIDKKIDIIVLTHFHPDHWTQLEELKQKNPKAQILIGEREVAPFRFTSGIFPSKTLKDDELFKTGKYSWKIIHCPGHTSGGISLWNKQEKILFSGDTLFADEIQGRVDLPYSIPEKMDSTLKKLKKLKPKLLLPGHGRIEKSL